MIAPLNWGLGHASRMVPVIRLLLSLQAEVVIGTNGLALDLLRKEFPTLKWITIPFPIISYSRKQNLIVKLILLIPKIIIGIVREHLFLKRIIEQENINIVISDNRYGLWNKKIPSIFISHQLMLKMPWWLRFAELTVHYILLLAINKFDRCWIPDFENEPGLSGDLTHKYKIPANTVFIGPLSKFNSQLEQISPTKRDILIILSGPEPQRGILENILLKQLKETDYKALIIRGMADSTQKHAISENIELISFLTSTDLEKEINSSKIIISRAGYCSIMDFYKIKRTAILIPTPGQTEQEYLGKKLKEKKMFYYEKQKNFQLDIAIAEITNYNPDNIFSNNKNLEEETKKLLST